MKNSTYHSPVFWLFLLSEISLIMESLTVTGTFLWYWSKMTLCTLLSGSKITFLYHVHFSYSTSRGRSTVLPLVSSTSAIRRQASCRHRCQIFLVHCFTFIFTCNYHLRSSVRDLNIYLNIVCHPLGLLLLLKSLTIPVLLSGYS